VNAHKVAGIVPRITHSLCTPYLQGERACLRTQAAFAKHVCVTRGRRLFPMRCGSLRRNNNQEIEGEIVNVITSRAERSQMGGRGNRELISKFTRHRDVPRVQGSSY